LRLGARHYDGIVLPRHLKKGHPTYVAVWEVKDYEIKLVEVTYVGEHYPFLHDNL
jgi:hypothetical protein